MEPGGPGCGDVVGDKAGANGNQLRKDAPAGLEGNEEDSGGSYTDLEQEVDFLETRVKRMRDERAKLYEENDALRSLLKRKSCSIEKNRETISTVSAKNAALLGMIMRAKGEYLGLYVKGREFMNKLVEVHGATLPVDVNVHDGMGLWSASIRSANCHHSSLTGRDIKIPRSDFDPHAVKHVHGFVDGRGKRPMFRPSLHSEGEVDKNNFTAYEWHMLCGKCEVCGDVPTDEVALSRHLLDCHAGVRDNKTQALYEEQFTRKIQRPLHVTPFLVSPVTPGDFRHHHKKNPVTKRASPGKLMCSMHNDPGNDESGHQEPNGKDGIRDSDRDSGQVDVEGEQNTVSGGECVNTPHGQPFNEISVSEELLETDGSDGNTASLMRGNYDLGAVDIDALAGEGLALLTSSHRQSSRRRSTGFPEREGSPVTNPSSQEVENANAPRMGLQSDNDQSYAERDDTRNISGRSHYGSNGRGVSDMEVSVLLEKLDAKPAETDTTDRRRRLQRSGRTGRPGGSASVHVDSRGGRTRNRESVTEGDVTGTGASVVVPPNEPPFKFIGFALPIHELPRSEPGIYRYPSNPKLIPAYIELIKNQLKEDITMKWLQWMQYRQEYVDYKEKLGH